MKKFASKPETGSEQGPSPFRVPAKRQTNTPTGAEADEPVAAGNEQETSNVGENTSLTSPYGVSPGTATSADGDPETSVLNHKISYDFEFLEKKTAVGTFTAQLNVTAKRERKLKAEGKESGNENEEQLNVELFNTGIANKETADGISKSISSTVMSIGHDTPEILPGVKISFAADAFNFELKENDELAFDLFKVSAQINGTMGEEQIKGTILDTPELIMLCKMGYSLNFSGTVEFTITELQELKRIKELIKLKDKLQPLAEKAASDLKKLDDLMDQKAKKVKELTDELVKKGFKGKKLKNLIRADKTIQQLNKQIRNARSIARKSADAMKPVIKKIASVSKKMKTVVGKTAAKVIAKTGLKIISRGLLKAIPIINVVSVIYDLIVIIRFHDVASSDGDGETPWAWDKIPENSGGEGESETESGEGSSAEGSVGGSGEPDSSGGDEGITSENSGTVEEGGSEGTVSAEAGSTDPEKEGGQATPGQSGESEVETQGTNESGLEGDPEATSTETTELDKQLEEDDENKPVTVTRDPSSKKSGSEGEESKKTEKSDKTTEGSSKGTSDPEGETVDHVYSVTTIESLPPDLHALGNEYEYIMSFPSNAGAMVGKDIQVDITWKHNPTGIIFTHSGIVIHLVSFTPKAAVYDIPPPGTQGDNPITGNYIYYNAKKSLNYPF